jgi:hypothetical protein
MRKHIMLIMFVTLALLLVSCGTPATPEATEAPEVPDEVAPEPGEEVTLTIESWRKGHDHPRF